MKRHSAMSTDSSHHTDSPVATFSRKSSSRGLGQQAPVGEIPVSEEPQEKGVTKEEDGESDIDWESEEEEEEVNCRQSLFSQMSNIFQFEYVGEVFVKFNMSC